MFFAKKAAVEYIVAGLGNPGKKYDGTRHNTGFAALDHLAQQWGAQVTKAKFDALVGTASVEGAKVLLLKPQ
ncbi:MAG TPA: aminoacyl-tRNA hydrolase, partial [Candidatus Ruthenibacterium merdipullorum]|nr:aminoacyl-tRNA hydrolase [Candidatus Ruthenibacterium merdipullorum]